MPAVFLSNCFTFNIDAIKFICCTILHFLLKIFPSDYHLSTRLIIYFAMRARDDKRIFTRTYVINDNSTWFKHRIP